MLSWGPDKRHSMICGAEGGKEIYAHHMSKSVPAES